jgi:hypothetical protein
LVEGSVSKCCLDIMNRTRADGLPVARYAAVRRDARKLPERCGGFVSVHFATVIETQEAWDRRGVCATSRVGIINEFTVV